MQAFKVAIVLAVIVAFATAAAPKKSNDDSNCSMCKFFVNTIESYLANNQTIAQIEQLLNNVCFQLPAEYQSQCVMMVANLPDVIAQIQKQYPADVVCTNIGFCSSKKIVAVEDTQCTFCEFGVDQIEQYLQQNATQQQIVAAVSNLCTLVPKDFTSACTALAQQVPVVISYLAQQYPAKDVCTMLGLCQQQAKKMPASFVLANLVKKN